MADNSEASVDAKTPNRPASTAQVEKTIPCDHCNSKFGSTHAKNQHMRTCKKAPANQASAASSSGSPADQRPSHPQQKQPQAKRAGKNSKQVSEQQIDVEKETEPATANARNNGRPKATQSIQTGPQPRKAAAPQNAARSTPMKRDPLPTPSQTPARYTHRLQRGRFTYPEYMTLEQAREEVAAGRAWEGILRANPNASRMCFFTIPGRVKDVMVKDVWLNRAFAGDTVIITMLNEADLVEEEKFKEERNRRGEGNRGNGGNGRNGGNQASNKNAQKSEGKNVEEGKEDENEKTDLKNKDKSTSDSKTKQKLSSNKLKGIESDNSDDNESVDTEDSRSVGNESDDSEDRMPIAPTSAANESQSAPKDSSSSPSSIDAEKKPSDDEIAELEASLTVLNMTTHANFNASQFRGVLEENKPKSELAKVIHIVNPFHEDIGYVGRLRRRADGTSFELRPLAIQHPIFDVPAPEPEYLDLIPMEEKKQYGPNGKISKRQKDEMKKKDKENSQLFITYFRRWDAGSRLRPTGTKPVFLGQAGDVEAECRAITSTHMIDTSPHPPALSAQFGTTKEITLSNYELSRRLDLRTSTRIFTIDPPTARDIDDAMSIEKLGENKYRVGVHIADVSHYVTPGSDLDKIAKQRSTSVYMVQTMFPMLPSALSENLCSLNPRVDRFAFSVMWDLDGEGNYIGNEWIGRTIIRSCAKLSYIDAQKCIDQQEIGDLSPAVAHLETKDPELSASDICNDILNLNKLAQAMRQRRFDGGALKLSRLRLHFELGEDGHPIEAHPYYIKESNQLIEEFMLLANMSVAKFIHAAFPECALLRSHPSPKEDMLESFDHLMQALGIPFDTSNSGALYKSLLQLEEWQHRPIEELVTKAMNAAIYVSTGEVENVQELWHYALNVPFYTHFTSPIRRYPDIVVHRQIQAALDAKNEHRSHQNKSDADSSLPAQATEKQIVEHFEAIDPCRDSKWVDEVCEHSNERKRSARKAQEDSIKLFACLYLQRQPYTDDESIVLDVSKNKLVVFSPNMCCKVKIDIANHPGFSMRFHEHSRVLNIYDDNQGHKCILSATYFSKISVTYFTKGAMPMDIGAELAFWYKPPTAKNDAKTQEKATSSSSPSPAAAVGQKKKDGASPSAPESSSSAQTKRQRNQNQPKQAEGDNSKRNKRNNKRRNERNSEETEDAHVAENAMDVDAQIVEETPSDNANNTNNRQRGGQNNRGGHANNNRGGKNNNRGGRGKKATAAVEPAQNDEFEGDVEEVKGEPSHRRRGGRGKKPKRSGEAAQAATPASANANAASPSD